MGDVAIAASVMKEVAAQNLDKHFVFATRSLYAPFFDDIPNLEVFPVCFTEKYKGLKGLFGLYKDLLKNFEVDTIVDLHEVLRSKLLTLFFILSFRKIKISTIDKGRKEKSSLCRAKNGNRTPLKSTWQRYVDAFQQLGVKTVINPIPIPYNSENVRRIGVFPFAQHRGKVYPNELLEKVIEMLNANYEIYLFGGGKNEQEICEKWQEKYGNVHSIVGKYSLKEELSFISGLDVIISMDSAGMHLASLCNIPCASIWGSTHPYSGFVGLGQENNPQIQLDLPCRPCSVYGNKRCKYESYMCLYAITPENIIEGLILKA